MSIPVSTIPTTTVTPTSNPFAGVSDAIAEQTHAFGWVLLHWALILVGFSIAVTAAYYWLKSSGRYGDTPWWTYLGGIVFGLALGIWQWWLQYSTFDGWLVSNNIPVGDTLLFIASGLPVVVPVVVWIWLSLTNPSHR